MCMCTCVLYMCMGNMYNLMTDEAVAHKLVHALITIAIVILYILYGAPKSTIVKMKPLKRDCSKDHRVAIILLLHYVSFNG